MLCVHIHVLRILVVIFLKITFYVAYVKIKKIDTKIRFFAMCFFLSFYTTYKKYLFSRNYV
jgi:hypothetical protein